MKPASGHVGSVPIGKNQPPRRLINTADIVEIDKKALVRSIQFRVLIGDILQKSRKLNELAGRVHRDLVGRFRGRHKVNVTHGQAEGASANIITK